MLLEFLTWQLVSQTVVISEFLRLASELTVTIWFPWLEQSSDQISRILINGTEEPENKLVPVNTVRVAEKPLLTLSEYRKLLRLRNAMEEPEGEEAVASNTVLSWMN